MAAAGVQIHTPIDQLSAMGFIDVLGAIPRHLRIYRDLVRRARAGRYCLAILIDYPGFHLRLGPALRRAGVPVLYYVAPQLWAWRPGRIRRLRQAANRLAAILPFEEEWFRVRGVDTVFVGHPLLDRAPGPVPKPQVYAGQRVLAIFPGSRAGEVDRHWPLFRDIGQQLLQAGKCDVVLVAGVSGRSYPEPGDLQILWDRPDEVMAVATAALIKSGTTTLEAALAGVPSVVCYRASGSSYRIARALMTVRWISLVNLVAGRMVVPEFWHLPIDPEAVRQTLEPLLDPASEAARQQQSGLTEVVAALGRPGAPRSGRHEWRVSWSGRESSWTLGRGPFWSGDRAYPGRHLADGTGGRRALGRGAGGRTAVRHSELARSAVAGDVAASEDGHSRHGQRSAGWPVSRRVRTVPGLPDHCRLQQPGGRAPCGAPSRRCAAGCRWASPRMGRGDPAGSSRRVRWSPRCRAVRSSCRCTLRPVPRGGPGRGTGSFSHCRGPGCGWHMGSRLR